MYQFFVPRGPNTERMLLPKSYRETSSWIPRLGDTFPRFTVGSTAGNICFEDWAAGKWTYVFFQPHAFGSICTEEILDVTRSSDLLKGENLQALSLCGSTVEDQTRWRDEIARTYGLMVNFPGAADPKLALAKCFDAVHPKMSKTVMMRKSFIIGPDLTIRSITVFPDSVVRRSADVIQIVRQLKSERRNGCFELTTGEESIVPRRHVPRCSFKPHQSVGIKSIA